MKFPSSPLGSVPIFHDPAAFSEEELFLLERLTARRADELARRSGPARHDVDIWLEAEGEILQQIEPLL